VSRGKEKDPGSAFAWPGGRLAADAPAMA